MDPVAGPRWRKSSHSGSNGGGCLEAASHNRHILIRDTRDRGGPVLRFPATTWRRFTGHLKDMRGPT